MHVLYIDNDGVDDEDELSAIRQSFDYPLPSSQTSLWASNLFVEGRHAVVAAADSYSRQHGYKAQNITQHHSVPHVYYMCIYIYTLLFIHVYIYTGMEE